MATPITTAPSSTVLTLALADTTAVLDCSGLPGDPADYSLIVKHAGGGILYYAYAGQTEGAAWAGSKPAQQGAVPFIIDIPSSGIIYIANDTAAQAASYECVLKRDIPLLTNVNP